MQDLTNKPQHQIDAEAQIDAQQRIEDLQADLTGSLSGGFHNMLEQLSNEQLGELVREYITESEHSSWEGFSFQDLLGIYSMLGDMALYQSNR